MHNSILLKRISQAEGPSVLKRKEFVLPHVQP